MQVNAAILHALLQQSQIDAGRGDGLYQRQQLGRSADGTQA
jgi:hypothetical protein